MARGAVRGMVSAWLGLIALQAVSTTGGSGRVASAFTDVNALLQRAIDPAVPAIPDRSGSASSTPSQSTAGATGGAVGAFTTADAADRNNPPASQASRLPWYRQPI